jgi:hypothetical protein
MTNIVRVDMPWGDTYQMEIELIRDDAEIEVFQIIEGNKHLVDLYKYSVGFPDFVTNLFFYAFLEQVRLVDDLTEND